MATTLFDVASARARFSSLKDGGFIFLDAPGGSQVPDEVGDAIARTLREASANNGAPYATSKRVEAIYNQARVDAGRFLNCSPDDVIFGANMTTLDFMLTRTASRDWRQGDKILVSKLDHDGGVAPWVELAADRGFEVDWIDVTPELRLDLDDLERKLDDRVRVVACVAASNAVGSHHRHPARRRARARRRRAVLGRRRPLRRARADRRRGARLRRPPLLAVQVLRPAPRPRVRRHELLESWRPYKARPAPTDAARQALRDRHAAVRAARRASPRRSRTSSRSAGWACCATTSATLGEHFLETLPDSRDACTACRRWRDASRPSCSTSRASRPPTVATTLAERGYGVWAHDNWYSLGLPFPYPGDAIRVGFIHYNTVEEVDGFVGELAALAG